MKPDFNARLTEEQIKALSSIYIIEGVKKDSWSIREIEITKGLLKARVQMTSFFISPTDSEGFHLTIFSAQEIIAQMATIYLHVYAGYEVKCKETWMRECNINYRSSIRDPENIMVEMKVPSMKEVADTVIGRGTARVYDDKGGLFIAKMTGMMR